MKMNVALCSRLTFVDHQRPNRCFPIVVGEREKNEMKRMGHSVFNWNAGPFSNTTCDLSIRIHGCINKNGTNAVCEEVESGHWSLIEAKLLCWIFLCLCCHHTYEWGVSRITRVHTQATTECKHITKSRTHDFSEKLR